MTGQAIIRKEDIIGGDTLVERHELSSYTKSADLKSAAYKEESYFAKASDLPPTPQYSLDIDKNQLVWKDDWIVIGSPVTLSNRAIKTYKCYIQTGLGVIDITPIVAHPRSETHSSTPPMEFYVKDSNGLITKTADFEFIHLEYSISDPVSGLVNYDTRKSVGDNVIQDENSGETYHSREMRKVFLACYPELWTQFGIQSFESIKQSLCGYNSVSASFEPKAAELFKAGMLFRPYVGGATTEQVGSNPHILKVGAHYGNWGQFGGQQERNITPADDVFLTNVIAVGARVDDTVTTELQTSYGRGLEFFEDITTLDVEFPAKTYLRDRSYGTIDATGYIYTATQPTFPDWVSKNKFQVGEKVYINLGTDDHDNPEASTAERAVVTEIINDYTVRFATPLTPGSGKVAYIYGDLTMLGGQQQSPTCSIVGAKLLKIKLLTGANWQLVREAARMTAKKTIDGVFKNVPGHWDKFRGFGKIQPDDAIQWIKDNYTENEDYQSAVSAEMEKVMGINPLLSFSSLGENTAIPKRMIPYVLSGMDSISEILDTDYIPVRREDGTIKMVSYSLLKTSLKTYFDTLYQLK